MASTAMSASVTGEVAPFNQAFGLLRKYRIARAPASSAAATSSARSPASAAGKRHAFHDDGRNAVRAALLEVGRRRQAQKHVLEVAGERDAAHRAGELA